MDHLHIWQQEFFFLYCDETVYFPFVSSSANESTWYEIKEIKHAFAMFDIQHTKSIYVLIIYADMLFEHFFS